jgi:nucleoid-associated protein YejK
MLTTINQELLKQMKEVYIPMVKGMIEKEKAHLQYLQSHQHDPEVKFFIDYSKYSIEQLTDRLAEYENWVEKNDQA